MATHLVFEDPEPLSLRTAVGGFKIPLCPPFQKGDSLVQSFASLSPGWRERLARALLYFRTD